MQHIPWEDTVIVIQSWQTDPANDLPLQVIFIRYDINLTDLIKARPAAKDFMRLNNEITGDLLKAGRWVILPQ